MPASEPTLIHVPLHDAGMFCRMCNCTEERACIVQDRSVYYGVRGCYWAEPGLCSVCAGLDRKATAAPRRRNQENTHGRHY
jgi:hypothetical protein